MSRPAPKSEINAASVLSSYRGARMYFEPLSGNHGDRLIQMGAERCMAQFGFERVERPEDAELIIVSGGGQIFVQGLVQKMAIFRHYSTGFPNTPLVVLPSSYYWDDPTELPKCLEDRTAPTTILIRGTGSYERIQKVALPKNVDVALDHDMAFYLLDSSFVEELRQRPTSGSLLVVERFDAERGTEAVVEPSRLARVGAWLPGPLQHLGRALLDRWRRMNSPVGHAMVDRAAGIDPSLALLQVVEKDVSVPTRNSFEDFASLIAGAEAVITTRLHPGILAAMLGKPTFLQGTTHPYNKIQSIYDVSMKDCPNVHLLPDLPVDLLT